MPAQEQDHKPLPNGYVQVGPNEYTRPAKSCSDPHACDGDAGCSLMCGKFAAEKAESEAIEKQQAESKPDQLCQLWASMEGPDQIRFIDDTHNAWADAYDLSPQARWCMTNERSADRQADAINAACKPGSKANPELVIQNAQRKCGAFPPPND